MRAEVLLALLALATVALAQPQGAEPQRIDCQSLLMAVDRVLEALAAGNYEGAQQMASLLGLANVTLDLRGPLSRFAGYSSSLAEALSRAPAGREEALELARNLTALAQSLSKSVSGLVAMLRACSVDSSTASTLSARASTLVEEAIGRANKRSAELLELANVMVGLNVSLANSTAAPGDAVRALVEAEPGIPCAGTAVLVPWPSASPALGSAELEFAGRASVELLVPGVPELAEVLGGLPSELAVIVNATCGGTPRVGIAVVELRAPRPDVRLYVPQEVAEGRDLDIAIYSDGAYNATVYANGTALFSLALSPGWNNVTLSAERATGTPGILTISVSVEPTERTPGATVSATLVVVRPAPVLEVRAPEMVVGLSRSVEVEIVALEPANEPLTVCASVNGRPLGNLTVIGSARLDVPLGLGLFDVVRISLVASAQGYREASYSVSVTYVNPLNLILASAAALLASSALAGGEFERTMRLGAAALRRLALRATRPTKAGQAQATTLSLDRPVASIYYSLLRRLGLRLPSPPETLREHLSSLGIGGRRKSLLGELMEMVEEELYSPRAPPIERAKRLSREVERIE
ncbi:MAG: hypothetical protein ABWK00_02030 [Desulfurococcaceae archaeon]